MLRQGVYLEEVLISAGVNLSCLSYLLKPSSVTRAVFSNDTSLIVDLFK